MFGGNFHPCGELGWEQVKHFLLLWARQRGRC